MSSVYHAQTQEQQGKETVSTFFLYRHPDKGYHLDYAFISHCLLEKTALTIPDLNRWLKRSDHLPLFLDIDTPDQRPKSRTRAAKRRLVALG